MMTELVVAFSLVMFIGAGDGRRENPTNLTFYSVDDCLYFAKRLATRYSNNGYVDLDNRDTITTYCVPKAVDPATTRIF